MAKQSGLHQIKGKIGEHSYYQQTGVAGGLVRRINQGLSEKVKTSEAFANTRLNNAEFGQAGRISSVLGMFITPKFRPMLLPFSQSKMAKVILEIIKTDSASWGQRNLTARNIPPTCVEALNSVAKGDFSSFGLNLQLDDENSTLTVGTSSSYVSKLASIGADILSLKLVACSPWIGTYIAGNNAYANSYARGIDSSIIDLESDDTDATITYAFRSAPPQGWPAIYGNFFVLILLPKRTINGTEHILQEHCTFFAFERVDGPVN